MKVSHIVLNKVDRLPVGYVFTYNDFDVPVSNKEAVIKALNRLVSKGKINKISKGKFYKPEKSIFGELLPAQTQVVKDLLEENGKIVGYLTGLSIFNSLGLTTQVSNTIQIGKNNVRPSFKRERYSISFIKQHNLINRENIPYLQILDCIKLMKKIPDTNIGRSVTRFISIISDYSAEDIIQLIRLSMKYPPSTRALLGAILDEIGQGTEKIFNTLNPISVYRYPGIDSVLTNFKKWNLK